MPRTVLCFSGGLDSTVLLAHLKSEGHDVHCLSIDYGQKHVKELEAAQRIVRAYDAPHRRVNLINLRPILAGSSQTDETIAVPEGHYAEESMKLTVVPNRNMLFLAVAGAWAVSLKADNVAYAAHGGDHAIYPDCRPEFAEAMEKALSLCDWHAPKLIRPFVHPEPKTKADIVKLGHKLYAPLVMTWSCYKGLDYHCGKCGTCTERREAFEHAGVKDPTVYMTYSRDFPEVPPSSSDA